MRDRLPATRLGRPAKKPAVNGGIRPRLFYGVFAALFATNVIAILALLMSPDISAVLQGQTGATLAAYQDRIDQLRLEIDRLHSGQFARTGDINIELQELAQQQEVLAEQHQYVKALADKAAELGIAPLPTTAASAAPVPLAPPAPAGTATSLSSDAGAAAVEQAGHQVRQMMDESRTALATISAEATSSTDQILAALTQVGIKPDMPTAGADGDAMGGPLLPPETGPDSGSMVDEANDVVTALTRFQLARAAIASAPVHLPINGPDRVSSGFGNRTDPFTGRLAFHPGIDFPWPQGTEVMAAGDGKVIFVGQINGYGNVIDIDHGGGIVTRYGHLSAFIATQGEEVKTGTPIGRVGSTGRSTGPHLHFEVDRNNQPVDPTFYLAVGKRLAHFLKPQSTAVAATVNDAPAPADTGSDDDSDAG